MVRAVARLLACACLIAGCGEPASKLPDSPDSGAASETAAPNATAEFSDVEPPGEEAARAADESGEEIYHRLECAGCHELAARPGQPVIPLERLSERYSAETLAAFLAAPTPPMPVFDLDDEQRQKLAWYLLSAHP